MKLCTKCKQEKPLSEFYKHPTSLGLYRSYCKKCCAVKKVAVGEKTCTKCGETKSYSEFGKKKDSKDGYQSRCKACLKKLYYIQKEPTLKELRGKNDYYKIANFDVVYSKNKKVLINYRKEIIDPISKCYNISFEDIMKSRKKTCVNIKTIIYFFLKERGLSFSRIGDIVGTHHTNVMYNLKKFLTEGLMEEIKELQMELFAEFDNNIIFQKISSEKTIKEIYNRINFSEPVEENERKRVLEIANTLEIGFHDALQRINELLEKGFKWIPIYNQNTQRKVIA